VWIMRRMCGKRKITFSDRPFSIFIFAAFLHRVAMVVLSHDINMRDAQSRTQYIQKIHSFFNITIVRIEK
jgi:hypothetical protein